MIEKWFPRSEKKAERQKAEDEVIRVRKAAEQKLDEGRDRLERLVKQMTEERQAKP